MYEVLVLGALLAEPGAARYGQELMRELGVSSGTLYPVLRRLEARGLITGTPEQADPRVVQRPARMYYTLTEAGARRALSELSGLASELTRLTGKLAALAAAAPDHDRETGEPDAAAGS